MKKVAVFDPAGKPLDWTVMHQGNLRPKRVRFAARRLAEEAFAMKWHTLWLSGYKVREVRA
jgi:hypothetical protein